MEIWKKSIVVMAIIFLACLSMSLSADVTDNGIIKLEITASKPQIVVGEEVTCIFKLTNISQLTFLSTMIGSDFFGMDYVSSTLPPSSIYSYPDTSGLGGMNTWVHWDAPSLGPGQSFQVSATMKGNRVGPGGASVFASANAGSTTEYLSYAYLIEITEPPTSQIDSAMKDNANSPVTLETPCHNASINWKKLLRLMFLPMSDPGNTQCDICKKCMETEHWFCIDPQAGDPINLNNLEFTLSAVDLEIPGRGMPYRFERHYRSRVHFNGPLGANWDFTYNMRLVPHPTESNQAILYDGKGRGDAYIILSDGTYLPPNAHFQKLIKESDNSLLLRQANGTIFKFYALDSSVQSGKLASILNRCGNRMTFEYNAKGQLVGTAI